MSALIREIGLFDGVRERKRAQEKRIAICLVALPFTPHVATSPAGASFVVSFAVLFGLLCLWLYWLLIATLVWGIKDDEE